MKVKAEDWTGRRVRLRWPLANGYFALPAGLVLTVLADYRQRLSLGQDGPCPRCGAKAHIRGCRKQEVDLLLENAERS